MELSCVFRVFTFRVICVFVLFTQFVNCVRTDLSSTFLQSIIRDFGVNGTLTLDQIYNLIPSKHSDISSSVPKSEEANITSNHFKCLSVKDVFQMYNITSSVIDETLFDELSPALLYLFTQNCSSYEHLDHHHHEHLEPPSALSIWGYGFLFVTLINLCSLVGVIVLPCMKLASYKKILIFMVALAVGALAGSGLLFLIPEAFGLVPKEGEGGDRMYIFKASTIMGGIYLFYLTEKVMRMITHWKERRLVHKKDMQRRLSGTSHESEKRPALMDIICSVKSNIPPNQEQIYKEPSTFPNNIACGKSELNQQQSADLIEKSSDGSTYGQDNTITDEDGSLQKYPRSPDPACSHQTVKPLAWMIIFGDGLHNFIDGLSIGTAFTQSTLSGISVSLAVMCEELPHELGDFAILLNCGMSVKKALMYNFLSACMCYLGLIVGTLLAESTSSHDWVFAIAGGMFLYISLADMMPEMNSASESEGGHNTGKIFLLQNLGLLTGFGIMFILALYGQNISLK